MAVVYEAFDRARGNVVALKCLSMERFSPGTQRESVVALFEREYYALSQLTHPHIIDAYDYGLDAEGPYYSMELLTGESLRARTPLQWREVCSLGRDIASALALLHSRSLVHRDVTPLNVHCDLNHRAKLIDFGAMIPAGVARHLVGTPAFIAPESLRQQSLDGRADLFALGACLYFAMTGRPPYSARSMDDLSDAWLVPPAPLSQFAADVPEALEELVLALLSIERDDRPRTAAEVYERLTTLADLPREEASGLARAYLSRPALVGRSEQLELLRESAQTSRTGRGCSLLVRGARGVGLSCMLDAAALEATLGGFQVARADSTAGQTSSLGAARQLLSVLVPVNPRLTHALEVAGLTTLVSEGLQGGLDADSREQTLDALTRAFLDGCEHAPLGLIVDDVHAIDEASLALLSGLAALAAEHRLMIVCSIGRGIKPADGSASALLSQCSRRIDLGPLSAEQSRELLASLFDDGLNIDVLAAVVHARCRGNPRATLEAAHQLVKRGVVRYEGGTWLIDHAPEALNAAIDVEEAVEQRLSRLSPDAIELLQTLAVDKHVILGLGRHVRLTRHQNRARMHSALSELVETQWAELVQDRIHLLPEDDRAAILSHMPDGRRREQHSALAEHCVELDLPPIYEAHHRLEAGDFAGAVAALDRFNVFVDENPNAEILRHPITLDTTDAISQLHDIPGVHPAMSAKYMAATVLNGTYRTLAEFTAERIPAALAEIARFSGLQDYAELTQLAAGERLSQALEAALQRCGQPGLGSIDLLNALRRQTQLSVTAAVTANFMSDARLVDAVPNLTPFSVLSPAIDAAAKLIDALSKLVRGQTWLAWDALLAVQRDLSSDAAQQLEPLTRMVLERVTLGYLCELNATFATEDAPRLIAEYAQLMPDIAASHGTRLCLAKGDLVGAAEARRRFEVMSVRTGGLANARIIELPVHLSVYALCGDIIGLRRTLRVLQDVAKKRPGFQARAELAQAQLLRWRGALSESLVLIESLLARLEPPHTDWQLAAVTQLDLLVAQNRSDEAVARGEDFLARAHANQLPTHLLAAAVAHACLAAGDHDRAEQHFTDAISQLEERGAQGVLPGCSYEIGARIALARGDAASFQERADACERHFRLGKHPALTARCNALRRGSRQGRHADMNPATASSETLMQTLRQLALKPIDDVTFFRSMLDRLIALAAAVGGVLYVHEEGALRRVAMAGAIAARPDLDALVARSSALDDASETAFADDVESPSDITDPGGLGIYTLELDEDDPLRIQGVLVLELTSLMHSASLRSSLRGVGAIMAERARLSARYGDPLRSRTTATHAPVGSGPDERGYEPITITQTK
jgi:hypothetical protein